MPDYEHAAREKGVAHYHHHMLTGFGKLGSAIHKFSIIFFFVGLIVFAVMMAGVHRAEKATSITELWVEEGTRLEEEKGFFDAEFGGLGRSEAFQIVNTADGITTAAALNLMISAITPITKEVETGVTNAAQISMDIDDASGTSITLTQKNFCSRPTVPGVWQQTASNPVLGGLPINHVTLAGSVAYGYQQVTVCLEAMAPGSFPGGALPDGWGIDRFPCTRITPVDCFAEGGFDYPWQMQLLQNVAATVAGHPLLATCLSTVETAAIPLVGPSSAAALKDGVARSVTSFAGMGYWWRPAYAAMSDADIFTHINTAIDNLLDTSIDTATCIGASSLARGGPAGGPTLVPCCISWSGTKYPTELYLGFIETDSSGARTKIGGTQNIVNNENEHHPDFIARWEATYGSEDTRKHRTEVADAWELLIADTWLNIRASADDAFTVNVAVSRSNSDIVVEATELESAQLAAGYVIMILFVIVVFGRFTCKKSKLVDSHILLGLGGLLTIALSTLCSFGLASWADIRLSPVNLNIVPFLSLGLGVDDMFVLGHTILRLENTGGPEKLMNHAWSIAGPSVALTSLANFLAFIITSATPLPVIQTFAYQMSMAVALNFFFLIFLFGPMMAWNANRFYAKRTDLCLSPVEGAAAQDPELNPPPSDGSSPTLHDDHSLLTQFARKYYAPFLRNWIVKIVVIIISLTAFGLLFWNALENTEQGIRPSAIALEGTYQADFLEIQETEFPAYTSYIVSRPSNFAQAQAGLLELQGSLQKVDPGVAQSLQISSASWLNSLIAAHNASELVDGVIPEDQFNAAFVSWITTTGSVFSADLACEDTATNDRIVCSNANPTTVLRAARVSVVQVDQVDTPEIKRTIELERQAADLFNDLEPDRNNNFIFGYIFQFWEQYFNIEENLYKIAAYSLLGVFIATLVLQASPVMSLILVFLILVIDVEVWGCIDLIDAALNGFSVGNLVMSIGLSVEFCAHVARSFHVADGSLNDRMEAALVEMFAPVTYGALSSFLPLLPLAFSDVPFFRKYYFSMFACMIAIAYLNGIVFLPVILSIFGPVPLAEHVTEFDDEKAPDTTPVSPIVSPTPVVVEMTPTAEEKAVSAL